MATSTNPSDFTKIWTNYERNAAHFGYPDCCVDSFKERTLHSHKSLYDELLPKAGLQNTGYIPCLDHLLRLSSKRVTIEEVLKNRTCRRVFPNECKPTARHECGIHPT